MGNLESLDVDFKITQSQQLGVKESTWNKTDTSVYTDTPSSLALYMLH